MADLTANSYGHMKLDWIKFRQMALERFRERGAKSTQSSFIPSSKPGKPLFIIFM